LNWKIKKQIISIKFPPQKNLFLKGVTGTGKRLYNWMGYRDGVKPTREFRIIFKG